MFTSASSELTCGPKFPSRAHLQYNYKKTGNMDPKNSKHGPAAASHQHLSTSDLAQEPLQQTRLEICLQLPQRGVRPGLPSRRLAAAANKQDIQALRNHWKNKAPQKENTGPPCFPADIIRLRISPRDHFQNVPRNTCTTAPTIAKRNSTSTVNNVPTDNYPYNIPVRKRSASISDGAAWVNG
jgi:hypothetical protein